MKVNFTQRFSKLSLSLAVCCFTVTCTVPLEGVASTRNSAEGYSPGRQFLNSPLLNVPTLNVLSTPRKVAQIIRGTVTDETGEGLPGVTVRLKGNTTVGTVTDFDGNYTLGRP